MPKEEALAKLNVASSALGTARANAMQNGHSTSLIALKEILKMAGVEGKDATQWLDTSGEPVSALLKAVVKGHAETIATYGTVLKALKVPKADAMRLLDARTSDGETAAFAAVAYGRPDSLEAYAQLLLGSGIKGQEAKPFMSLHSNDGVQADKITPKHSLRSVMQALNRSLPLLHLTMADVV
ncbi:MAG: hypothetical protein QOI13_1946, partial [Paraburkholderia sp.]|nr:hypothetical protein [Paraburkholderia sp.]